MKFHDGTDFNAKAVKWNMEKYKAGPNPELRVVTSVEVVDDYTVKINISEYQAFFLSSFALGGPGVMVSPAAYQAHDEAYN